MNSGVTRWNMGVVRIGRWRNSKGTSRRRNYISNENMHGRVTTREMLLREYQIVSLAHDGISRFWPLAPDFVPNGLADDQKQAVERILNSRNFITLFRGGAGTGKSFALQAVNQGLTEAGHSVLVVTPQRQQAIDLAEAGFQETQTVSELLARQRMPSGAVVLVDEAGQIGAQQMLELLKLVQSQWRPGHPFRRHPPAWRCRSIGRPAGD